LRAAKREWEGEKSNPQKFLSLFAPSFPMSTSIEECCQSPLIDRQDGLPEPIMNDMSGGPGQIENIFSSQSISFAKGSPAISNKIHSKNSWNLLVHLLRRRLIFKW
jgi:hypothetical protein